MDTKPAAAPQHNVVDKFRGWELDLIKEDLKKNAFPYAVLMDNVSNDFNVSTFVRNGNAFGASEIFYKQDKKHYDKRGTVGTHLYSRIEHLKTMDDVKKLTKYYKFVAVDIGLPNSCSLYEKTWEPNTLLVFGSEGEGISKDILELCSECVYIPMFGSVRSLNVGTSSGIIMSHIASQMASKR